MGKFGCSCGNIISDVAVPNEVTGFVLSDKSFDLFSNSISNVIDDFFTHLSSNSLEQWKAKHFNEVYPADVQPSGMIHDVLTDRLMEITLGMFECDSCGRLWIQENPTKNKYRGFAPDDSAESRVKILGLNQSSDQTDDAG